MGPPAAGDALHPEPGGHLSSWREGPALPLWAEPHPGPVSSLYVHAPFCTRRCRYCDFAVQVRRSGDTEAWAEALAGELSALEREGLFTLPDRLATLYVGGGTPSLLGEGAMGRLAGLIGPGRLADPALEWTAEANPESLTPAVARGWVASGLNRVSLGVQSFQEPVLRWMGRLHGAEGSVEAVARAREAGLDNLSVDLIFGLPAALGRSWTLDLERALALRPPHLSLYGLSVEPGTPLGREVAEGREQPVDEARYADEFLEAAALLAEAGYHHYEVSNFALPGWESRHNAAYWSGDPWLGLGNGAHSYLHPLRRWNVREWGEYEGAARQGLLPVQGSETLEPPSARLERVWLGLRTSRGLETRELTEGAAGLVARWEARGWATTGGGRLRLTAEGWLLLDRLAVELDHALDRAPDPRAGARGGASADRGVAGPFRGY